MTIYLAMLEAYLKSHLEAPFDTPSAVSICGDPQQAALSALIDELNSLIGLQAVKCVFRSHLDTRTSVNWTVIPVLSGHRFR